MDPGAVLLRLIGSPNLASRAPVYEQYDSNVQANTVVAPGHGAAILRIKGTTVVASKSADSVDLTIDATFASSGKPGPFDRFEIQDGRAKATISFDVAQGVVRSARVETTYVREKTDPKKTDKPANVNETWTFAFAGIDRVAYPKFVPDVNGTFGRTQSARPHSACGEGPGRKP